MSERADNVRFFYFQDPEHVRPWQLWGAGMTERKRVAYFSGLNFQNIPTIHMARNMIRLRSSILGS